MPSFRSLRRSDALEILRWKYEPPYDLYNHRPQEEESDLAYVLNPKNGFFSIHDESEEGIGFCSFGPDAQVPGGDYALDAVDIGLGIRPDLAGRGKGAAIIGAVLEFAAARFKPKRWRVTIAAFNKRARKAWAKAGFVETGEFIRKSDGRKFVILSKEL